ncbi:hypothetical protein IQ06DRAFT_357189, partial [Phaeosphaeriaceae sp. SRC1lsM3a]
MVVSGLGQGTAYGRVAATSRKKGQALDSIGIAHAYMGPGKRSKRSTARHTNIKDATFSVLQTTCSRCCYSVSSHLCTCACVCVRRRWSPARNGCGEMLYAICAGKSRGCVKVWSCTAIIFVDPGTRCRRWRRHVPWCFVGVRTSPPLPSHRPILCGTTPPLCNRAYSL